MKNPSTNLLRAFNTLISLDQARLHASSITEQTIDKSNIEFLVRFGHLRPHKENGITFIEKEELENYYLSRNYKRELLYKEKLGKKLHWHLSFDQYKERETTKHVHRLHPYKGKYIPQLVEYLMDGRTDEFKPERYFEPQDIVLDPFCGSGTTMIQANELGIHSIGIDVSEFNCAITRAKLEHVSLDKLLEHANYVEESIKHNSSFENVHNIDRELGKELTRINAEHFNPTTYRPAVREGKIDEAQYCPPLVDKFKSYFLKKTRSIFSDCASDSNDDSFLGKWFLPSVQKEILVAKQSVSKLEDSAELNLLKIILSRTIRSVRATKHYDLATLIEPCHLPYYCKKHYKICKPTISMLGWWRRYVKDTVKRVLEFDELRSDAEFVCFQGDSRRTNIFQNITSKSPYLSKLVSEKAVSGIVTSPPYVGIIDYHEQHAYAYELFDLDRRDDQEIGPLYSGSGSKAKKQYSQSIIQVLKNCRTVLKPDCNVFVVVNDKYDLYPDISKAAGFQIHNRFERPVLNRAEGNKGFYSESIIHLKIAG